MTTFSSSSRCGTLAALCARQPAREPSFSGSRECETSRVGELRVVVSLRWSGMVRAPIPPPCGDKKLLVLPFIASEWKRGAVHQA